MREELLRILVVLVSSTIATTGIIMMFGIERRVLVWAALSSILCCGGYEVTMLFGGGLLLSCLVGAALSAIYSDVMAHWLKVPATVLIIPGIVPLVPGGKLYYTMLAAVQADMDTFSLRGKEALLMAAGLAIGVIAVTVVSKPLNARIVEIKAKKNS